MNALPTIRIDSTEVRSIPRDGKSTLNFQNALFERGDGVVLPVEVSLGNRAAHKVGRYALSLRSFVPGKFGSVEVRIELDALTPALAVAK
jgi:hypothetical protein